MRRLALAVAVVFAIEVLGVPAARLTQAQTPVPSGPPPLSLSALVDQVRAVFPEVQGEVVELRDRTVTLSAGSRAGAMAGLLLEVYREGREIRSPRTGEVLGRTEEALGRAIVTQAFDGYSVAAYEGSGAAPGDRVRTPAGKVKLTLLSLSAPGIKPNLVEAAANEIYEGFRRTERFNLTLGDQIALWATQQKIEPEEILGGRRVLEAMKKFQARNLLVLHFRQVERKPFLEVRLFTETREAAALSTALYVPPSVKPVDPGRFSGSDRVQPAPERKPRSFLARLLFGDIEPGTYSSDTSIRLKEIGRFGFPMISMDVGVAPADKIPRVALTDGEKVWVYRIVNGAMEPEWTYSARAIGRIYSVQLASLAGDGTLQVVANRFDTRIGMSAMILGLKEGKPVPLVNHVDWILLALDEAGTGVKQTLWSQPYDERTFFDKGRIERMALRNGALASEGKVRLPYAFRATGAATSNVAGKDRPRALAFIDEQNRLRLTAGADEVWSSSSHVGGSATKIEVERQMGRDTRSYFYRLEPIPLSIDLDGDGIEEIVIPQNQVEGMLAVVYRSAAGIRFQQVNTGFSGVITGIGGFRSDESDQAPTLVATVVRYTSILKTSGETQILMTLPGD